MKERLNIMLEAYSKEILRADACNQLYFDMRYNNGRNERVDEVYKIAPAFFSLSRKALQTEAFLAVSKLYEPEGRADFNLFKLMTFIKGNAKNIDSNRYKELNKLVNELEAELRVKSELATNLLYIRDKVIAHNSKEHFLEVKEKNYPNTLTFEDVIELIAYASTCINKVSSFVFDSVYHHKYTAGWHNSGHDFDNLMNFCLKHIDYKHPKKPRVL